MEKPEHKRKMVAPIVIALLVIAYYSVFFAVILMLDMAVILKVICGIVPIGIIGVMIYVVNERISEIRSGEEDDLSKY